MRLADTLSSAGAGTMRLPLTPGVTLMLKLASGVRLEVKLTPCVTLMWKLASGVRFGSICVVLAYFQAVVCPPFCHPSVLPCDSIQCSGNLQSL